VTVATGRAQHRGVANRLLNRARKTLACQPSSTAWLRQSYAEMDKFCLIKHRRYAMPPKRVNEALKILRTYLAASSLHSQIAWLPRL
jgi:hypothetical protein